MIKHEILTGIPQVLGKVHANNYTQTGFYIVPQDSGNVYGFPELPNGIMSVENYGDGIVRQMYSDYSAQTWMRICWYGTWFSWRKTT